MNAGNRCGLNEFRPVPKFSIKLREIPPQIPTLGNVRLAPVFHFFRTVIYRRNTGMDLIAVRCAFACLFDRPHQNRERDEPMCRLSF
jgi:hypothetical protein